MKNIKLIISALVAFCLIFALTSCNTASNQELSNTKQDPYILSSTLLLVFVIIAIALYTIITSAAISYLHEAAKSKGCNDRATMRAIAFFCICLTPFAGILYVAALPNKVNLTPLQAIAFQLKIINARNLMNGTDQDSQENSKKQDL